MDKNKDKAFSMALKYLGFKMRTEKEIKDYLLRKKFSEEDILYTVEKLRDYKYINDEEFADFWIRDKYHFYHQGKYRIKNDLYKKGISKELINEKVNSFFDDDKEIEKIKILYNKKNPLNKKMTDKEIFSICNYIVRKGFTGSLVKKIILQNRDES